MRDSLINSIEFDYGKTSSFADGRKNILAAHYRYVYEDQKVYMLEERDGEFGKLVQQASFDGEHFKHLQHYTRTANISSMPIWHESIDDYYRIGPDDTRIGRWFSQEKGAVVDIASLDGRQVYVLSDGDIKRPGWSYTIWVVPELGFSPIRIDERINGVLKNVMTYRGTKRDDGNSALFSPAQVTLWKLNLDDGLTSFDPENPQGDWIRIDAEVQRISYNIDYPDSLFNLAIPDGYMVVDQVLGLNYVMGRLDSDVALDHLISDVKTAFGSDLGSSHPSSQTDMTGPSGTGGGSDATASSGSRGAGLPVKDRQEGMYASHPRSASRLIVILILATSTSAILVVAYRRRTVPR